MIELAGTAILATAVVATGVGIVRAKHDARQLFVELEELNRERDRLQVDWGRLQLEQGAIAAHSRIEPLARETLDFVTPSEVVVVGAAE
jgi:cell division protein FtsL